MACPFDEPCNRHPTPPLSPSTSSGSSRSSSAPSFSPSPISSLLQREIGNLRPACPESQYPRHRHSNTKLALMTDRLEDDTMMLDDWEEGRLEGAHGTPLQRPADLVSFPFQLAPSSSAGAACSHHPSQPQQQSLLPQELNSLPSAGVIDAAKLARQDQPPLPYENVDERPSNTVSHPSPVATRGSRSLARPPLDCISGGSSSHSLTPATDVAPVDPFETADPASQSSSTLVPNPNNPLSTGRPLSSSAGTSQRPTSPLELLHSLDHSSSQNWLDGGSTSISAFPSQGPVNALPPGMTPESSQQSISAGSFDRDSSWISNQSFLGTQQGTSAASVTSRPISSGSLQTLSRPSPYSLSEVSAGCSLSEYALDVRSTSRPPLVAPAPSRGLPPPAPPTILDPPPARPNAARNHRAPHEPFLCDAPPPPDSWIAVETSPVEYRLVARLPGFRRDAITLAARRRRVLHVVADSWEPGGGHFERRISFGYDADLSQVRAEFDGEILRVIVPRRTPALTWYGGACE